MVCRCFTMCTHFPVMDLNNNIWITVFSPHHYRILWIQSDILVLSEASSGSQDDPVGVASCGVLVLNSVCSPSNYRCG